MRFSLKIREYFQRDPDENIAVVNYDTVTFEVARYLAVRGDDYGQMWAPMKQYFFEIHQDDDGCIHDIRQALAINLNGLYSLAGHVGVFTLWIKGRRYSQFSCSPNDLDDVRDELIAEVDSDMAFNREEWGLTEKQRRAKSQ